MRLKTINVAEGGQLTRAITENADIPTHRVYCILLVSMAEYIARSRTLMHALEAVMIRLAIAAAALLIAPSAAFAQAKIDFATYEGPPQIQVGTGGTKITKNGIDYWTTGTPPRRYQIIGFVQDKRDETWDGGHAVGSPNIAKKVRKAGGDAVVIQSQDEAGKAGSYGTGLLGGLFMGGGSKTVTRMLVIRYLPDAPAPAPEPERKPETPQN